MPVLFNGQYLVTPAVASAVDDSPMYPRANASGNVLALIGEASGGPPKTPVRIQSPMHAKQVLRSGPLYEAVVKAFAPSTAAGSPAAVLAVRVDPAVRSSAVLLDAAGQPSINLVSSDYGAHTNSLEVRLQPGSRYGYQVAVRQNSQTYYRDNVGADVLTARYTGTAADAALKVTANKLTLEAPIGTVVREYILEDWANAAALVESLSGTLPDWQFVLQRGQERFAPANFDALNVADAKTAPAMVTGHAYSIVRFINSSQEIFTDATYAATPATAPAMTGWIPLLGGLNGNVLPVDWEEAIASLQAVEAHWLVPLSDNPATWDMVASHCDFMSARNRERRAFVGGDSGLTSEQAQVHARGLNSDRVGYVWPAIYEYDYLNRQLLLKPAWMAAVALAASFASISPGTTMSRKSLQVAGAEVRLREPTDTDSLIESGVCPLVQSDVGTIVSQAISTWQLDDRYNRKEISVGAAVDYVMRVVRAAVQPMLGERGDMLLVARARSRVESALTALATPPPYGPGTIVAGTASPAYRNVQISLEGDTMRVAFECSPVIPINYVLISTVVSPLDTQ